MVTVLPQLLVTVAGTVSHVNRPEVWLFRLAFLRGFGPYIEL
jgi:hypothetical protein